MCQEDAISFSQQQRAMSKGEGAIGSCGGVGACVCNIGMGNRIVYLVFGKQFRNSPYRFRGLRAIRGEHGGARVSSAPVVDQISRYPDVRARPEPLLRTAPNGLRAVLAVAPVVAANVGPLEGMKRRVKFQFHIPLNLHG